jgi:FkbM family methyltransferase
MKAEQDAAASSEGLVRSAYRLLLDREPEPAGLKHWSEAITGGLTRNEFLRSMIASAECREKIESADFGKYRDVDLIIPLGAQRLRVPASDLSILPILLEHRCWEPHITAYLTSRLRPEHVFMDVGANLGYFTVLCAPLVERVVAFEPVDSTRGYCAANVSGNGLTNVDVYAYGLWHEETTMRISHDSSSVVGASITQASGDLVWCMALDGMIARGELSLSRLDFVKMDIEGAEVSALTGAEQALSRFRPEVIMEVNGSALARHGRTVDDVWRIFARLGYGVRAFEHWVGADPEPVNGPEALKRLCPDDDGLVDVVAIPA